MPVNRLMKFVELCKACGVTISPSESVAFTSDFARVALENKMLAEEAAVACLAKDSESEAIVRKLFRLFFTGRPEDKQEEESDNDHVDSQLAHALREALESGELHFDNANFDQNEGPASEQSEGTEMSPGTSWRRHSCLRRQPEQSTPRTDMPTKQPQHQPNIQAVPTHHPQKPDRAEIERELAQFMHDNLSGRDLERIIDLLEKLNALQNTEHLAELARTGDRGMMSERQNELETPGERLKCEGAEATEDMDEQLGELPTDEEMMLEQQGEQGMSPGKQDDGSHGAGDGREASLATSKAVASALKQGSDGDMGFMGRGNRGTASSLQNFQDNPAQRTTDAFDAQDMENPDISPPSSEFGIRNSEFGTTRIHEVKTRSENSNTPPPLLKGAGGISRFNIPLSLEAAQTLSSAFVQELTMFNVPPSLGGRLARLMNPEQGRNLARQHQMALELWMLTDQERERLLQSLEYVVGRLLLQDCITPEEFAEYSALFDEYLKAQITIAGAGAETHLKNVSALATLLTRYKSEAQLLRVIVSRLSTAMHRLLSRRMPIYAKSSGGKLDVRKTIRQSLQYGGVPMEFIYREKVLWEDIILALDTSGSQVWWAVSAMLFAAAFEKIARRLRVYSFTSDIEDVTKYVPNPEKFVQHLDDFAGYSNYETSFQQLLSKAPISPRTTLLIVGDCRDYQGSWQQKSPDKYGQRIGPHSAKLMGKLVTRSNKVIVLNPEEKLKWGVGDSAALDYEQAGAIVKYVDSPLDLAEQLMNV